jgi:transcriptional regulator GlxA family with amidase domain
MDFTLRFRARSASGAIAIDDTVSAIMKIAVLLLDGVFDIGLAALLDTFALANGFVQRSFDVTRVGVRRRVKTGQGFAVDVERMPARADLLVVPALAAKSPDALDLQLVRPDVRDAAALVSETKATKAAACTATFLLAHAGLLDDRAATTTWWLAPAFRERFPRVRLDEARMIVEDGDVMTAGAALAHLDLALSIVRRKSPALARTTARHLAFERRPGELGQSAYEMPGYKAHADPMVERFEVWARNHLAEFSLARAAKAVGTSERTLERRVHRAVGRSPVAFVQDLRVEEARHQLETTDRGIDEIAQQVGYRDGVTLRTLLRKKTGLGVRELRTS